MHAALLVAPVAAEYLPAAQSAQAPSHTTEYLPAVHSMHVERSAAPVAEEPLPAGQRMHAERLVASVVEEYVPAGQSTQRPLAARLAAPAIPSTAQLSVNAPLSPLFQPSMMKKARSVWPWSLRQVCRPVIPYRA